MFYTQSQEEQEEEEEQQQQQQEIVLTAKVDSRLSAHGYILIFSRLKRGPLFPRHFPPLFPRCLHFYVQIICVL